MTWLAIALRPLAYLAFAGFVLLIKVAILKFCPESVSRLLLRELLKRDPRSGGREKR